MERRLQLDDKIRALLNSENVYFQPPASIRMHYPAVRYKYADPFTLSADDKNYHRRRKYTGVYIHLDPDDYFVERMVDSLRNENISAFSERRYEADNLYHDPFTIYY